MKVLNILFIYPKDMKEEIMRIIQRNRRVEADKAWETSTTRTLLIAGMTYALAVLFLQSIHTPHLWLNALVPTGGFILSTLTLPLVKQFWLKNVYKK